MGQTVFIPRELDANEPRVAASPDTVKRLAGLGFDVVVESGAGTASRIPDEEFAKAGAAIGKAGDVAKADVVLKVRRPMDDGAEGLRPAPPSSPSWIPMATMLPSMLWPRAGVTAFSMEFMPRITRAQSMDVLSSRPISPATRR